MNTTKKITGGSSVTILKGCQAREIAKGTATVKELTELGSEYGHSVRVVLTYKGRNIVLFARHLNRLGDPQVNLNTGNPLHTIKICLK